MKIINRTVYCGRALRSFVLAACKALNHVAHPRARVYIRYARAGQSLCGTASYGGTYMVLYVPRRERYESSFDETFWTTALHEVGHWKGWRHAEYPTNLRWCVPQPPLSPFGRPAGLVLRFKTEKPKADPLVDRIDHARTKLVKIERRIKALTTRAKTWRRRLRTATAAMERRTAAGSSS